MSFLTALLPDSPRDFPARRLLRAVLRTLHILGGGVLIGAVLFGQAHEVVQHWWLLATLSGVCLFATDLHASFAILFEWRGLAIMSKVGLLLALPLLPGWEAPILMLILAIGSISSHLSRRFRHRLWRRLPRGGLDSRAG